MYQLLIKPIFFLFQPESIHHFVFKTLKIVCNIPGMSALIKSVYRTDNNKLKRELFGLTFENPVGLAAGFDKDAKLYNELANFGFGFIEIISLKPPTEHQYPVRSKAGTF